MGALGALALWVEGNVIVASGTDHGLPRVEALAKPQKIGIGVLGPFSVRASDTWSPIVDVTWRYGDGTSEHGATVRHAYRARGRLPRHGRRGRRGRQHGAAHVRRRRRPIARAAGSHGDAARAEGVDRVPALEPERHRHGDGRHCRARRPCRSAAPCPAAAARSCPGRSSAASASSCASPASTSRAPALSALRLPAR